MKGPRKKTALLFLLVALLCLAGCEQPAGPLAGMDIYPEAVPAAPGKPELIVWDQGLGVSWNTLTGAESYAVYYGTTIKAADAQGWTGPVTLEAGTASAFITGLENGTRYYVWVSAANSAGESPRSEYAYAKPERLAESGPHIFFDHGWMIPSYAEEARFYTVRQGQSLVLTPVRWRISESAAYTWTVNGAEQQSGLSGQGNRYFTFTPGSTGDYTVAVTAADGAEEYSARTQVICTGAYAARQTKADSSPKALNAFGFMPAPGQFAGGLTPVQFNTSATADSVKATIQTWVSGAGSAYCFSLGSFGGYVITGCDHSVANTNGGYELTIKGNAFGNWGEPGVVWVSRDDNGNNQPDDTWYELKGNQHGTDTKRYAVTWIRPSSGGLSGAGIWMDNLGNTGTYPKGYPQLQNMDHFTLTGTQLRAAAGGWGYVDILGNERFRISDAVQVDGSPANLDYIDFVKVQNAVHEMAGVFGEISCETGVPFDLSIPNPSLLITGAPAGAGQWSYTFKANGCGYDMFVSLDGGEFFEHPRSAPDITLTLNKAQVYFDYYGGNVLHYHTESGIIAFGSR
jgi:hypothetical protein